MLDRQYVIGLWLIFRLILGILFANGVEVAAAEGEKEAEVVRAVHLAITAVDIDDVKARIDEIRSARFNHLILGLGDGVRFQNYPSAVRADAWDVEELRSVVQYARGVGLTVVPEIKFLTHQEKFFKNQRPDLMFNKSTSNPSLQKVQNLQVEYIDEVLRELDVRAVHIGHDEVAGFVQGSAKKWLNDQDTVLPASLFEESVIFLHRELRARGVEVWMWGDMLVSPDEFPGMLARHLHGIPPGYGKPLRDQLPKDIVICDWHYFDEQVEFPTVSVLRGEGFRVLGATWKQTETTRNFAAYAALHGAQGMIATTWFHVQRKEWDVVDRIIRESGEAFAASFPDRRN